MYSDPYLAIDFYINSYSRVGFKGQESTRPEPIARVELMTQSVSTFSYIPIRLKWSSLTLIRIWPYLEKMAVLSSQCSSSSQLLKHKRLTSDTPSSPANTHKKRRKKTMSLIDDNLDSENGISSVLGSLDRYRLADYLTQRTKKFSENLSLAQVEEKRVPGIYERCIYSTWNGFMTFQVHAITETASWQRPRILDNLPEFIKEFSSCIGESTKLPLSLKDTGSPHTVVVTAAGLRAADITRYFHQTASI